MRRFLIPILLALGGLLFALWLVPAEQRAVAEQLAGFPDSDVRSHELRPVIVALLCLLPALGGLLYVLAGTMARYISREFLSLLAIAFCGLAVVWLLIDFQDNLEEMKRSGDILGTAAKLYATRLPEMAVMLLPYALLLSLLFCLGKLSNSREIVAMIQTGRGIGRLTAPFIVTGAMAAILSLGLNYYWAPRSTAMEKVVLDEAAGVDPTASRNVRFRHPTERRLWLVGAFPLHFEHGKPLREVRVVTERNDGTPREILTAERALWAPQTGAWTFEGAELKRVAPGVAADYVTDLPDPYVVEDWGETPFQIIQPGLPADQLGVPGLNSWLASHPSGSSENRSSHLTQWHYRWAQPLNCVIVVLLATPLGLVFSRRGKTGGLAVAVFLAAGMLFLTTVSLSLGDAGEISPLAAAWIPNLVFGGLSIYLFHRRLAGRPIYQTLRRWVPNPA